MSVNPIDLMNSEGLDDVPDDFEYGRYADGWSEDNWEEEFEKHPIFMTKPPEQGEMPPMVKALQDLKYDPKFNSPEELARVYKDDGNENFKLKKYRWAVLSYTEGLKQKSSDNQMNSMLLGNRSAAHFFLGNYRSALRDASKAFHLNENNLKAMVRVAQCHYHLKEYQECIAFCEKNASKDEKLNEWRDKAKLKEADLEAETAKEEELKREQAQLRERLTAAVEKRNIKVKGSMFDSFHPAAQHAHAKFNDSEELLWPVIFVYPEYNQTDFIEEFNENATFSDCFDMLFNEENWPPWDVHRKYRPDRLVAAFSWIGSDKLIPVDSHSRLIDVMSSEKFYLLGANPTFTVTCRDSV